jgi:hypothetical protein
MLSPEGRDHGFPKRIGVGGGTSETWTKQFVFETVTSEAARGHEGTTGLWLLTVGLWIRVRLRIYRSCSGGRLTVAGRLPKLGDVRWSQVADLLRVPRGMDSCPRAADLRTKEPSRLSWSLRS